MAPSLQDKATESTVGPSKPGARVITSSYLKPTASTSNRATAPLPRPASRNDNKPPHLSNKPPGATSTTTKPAPKPIPSRSTVPRTEPPKPTGSRAEGQDGSNKLSVSSAGGVAKSRHGNPHADGATRSLSRSSGQTRKLDASISSSAKSSVSSTGQSRHPGRPPSAPSVPPVSSTSSHASHSRQTVPENKTDPIQVAAQTCTWVYLYTNLRDVLSTAESTAQETLNAFSQSLSAQETGISEQKLRSEAERLVSFLDELIAMDRDHQIALVVQDYVRHENAWAALETAAMNLANSVMSAPAPSAGEEIAALYNESTTLLAEVQETEDTITSLAGHLDSLGSERPCKPTMVAKQLVAVLDARRENVMLAEELMVQTRDILSASIRLDSIQLSLAAR